MAVIGLRSSNAYVGLAKQTAGGVATAPTNFPRWMDGSEITLDLSAEDIWEGDTSRRLSQIIKKLQKATVKLVCAPRPVELGFLEEAALGAASDTVTPATASTTTSGSSNTAGSTTLTLTANTGLTTGTPAVIIEPGTANEEVVTLTTPPTGVGPYVFTIANGGTLKFTHAAASVVATPTTHTLVDTSDGNFYTVEVSLGGTSGLILRIRDCKVESCKRSAKAGGALMYELEFVGIAALVQVSAATVTLEAHQLFLFTQGAWTLNTLTTGDALNLDSFDITTKNNLDQDIQTEQVTLGGLIYGNVDVAVTLSIVYTVNSIFGQTYFGGTTGTADSQTIVLGSIKVVFTQADNFHAVTYNLGTVTFTKAEPPKPSMKGKAFRVASIESTGTSNQGAQANVLQAIVANGQTAAYN